MFYCMTIETFPIHFPHFWVHWMEMSIVDVIFQSQTVSDKSFNVSNNVRSLREHYSLWLPDNQSINQMHMSKVEVGCRLHDNTFFVFLDRKVSKVFQSNNDTKNHWSYHLPCRIPHTKHIRSESSAYLNICPKEHLEAW